MTATKQAMEAFVHETGGWVASQMEACTRCGMCAEACHFYQSTGNPEYAKNSEGNVSEATIDAVSVNTATGSSWSTQGP